MRDVDGKAWIVSARTSIGTRARIASTHSWIAAEASGQAIAAPMRVPRRAVDDDRHVAALRLDARSPRVDVAKSATNSTASIPSACACSSADADERGLRVGVRGARQRPVVGLDRVAEGHPHRDLALVVRLVRVQLGAGRVADDPQPVGEAEPAVARERRAAGRVDAVALEAEVVDREVAPDGQQDRVALGGRAVGEVDDVRAVAAGAGAGRHARARLRRTSTPSSRSASATTAELRGWSVGMSRSPDWTIVDRDAEAGVRLGELAARRAATEDEQAPRQLAGEGGLAIGPDVDRLEARERRHLRERPDGDDHVRAPGARARRRRAGPRRRRVAGSGASPAIDDGTGLLERLDVRGVVGLRARRLAG